MGKRLTNEDFIRRCSEIHNNIFDYSKTFYRNSNGVIVFTCSSHGDVEMRASNHLHMRQGCNRCSQESHKLVEITPERLEKIKTIHNNKYSYVDLSVNSGKIKITCPSHGEFIQSIYNHEYGHGCYNCERESRKKIRTKVCKSCNIDMPKSDFLPKYRICKECCVNKIIPDFKFCNKCGVETPISEFPIRKESKDGHRNECKTCFNESRIEPRKLYKKKNRKILQEKDMIYRKERMKTDPFYRAKMDARNIVRKALREKGYIKSSKTEQILGCSFIEFKNHIESLFLPGMIWENRDEWHIDHIVPLGFAINESEILQLNYYTNLRPLWIKDNLEKSNVITEKTEIYYRILSNRD